MQRLSSFDSRDNGITAARLGLALMVVASHSVPADGRSLEPLLRESQNHASLGFVAVIAFFALSGFLLTGSRERTSVPTFLRNRALRILPGYWLALAFSMLVAVPICAAIRGTTIDPSAVQAWVAPRLLFMGGPQDAPFAAALGGDGVVNGALWTLGVEVLCYLVLALTPRRWLRPVVLGALALILIWEQWTGFAGPGTALLLAFVLGATAWLWRAWIPMSGRMAVCGAIASLGLLLVGAFPLALGLISYTALGLAWLPIRLERDLSYGTYVLGCPVQNVLCTVGIGTLAAPAMIAASIGVILPLAILSWTLVERPALSLKTGGRKTPSCVPGEPEPRLVAVT